MTEVIYSIRRLEKLQEKVGYSRASTQDDLGKNNAGLDTNNMTPYEIGQYQMAMGMKRVRENITELDELGPNASATRRAELGNVVRKDLNMMRKEAVSCQKLAVSEGRQSEFELLTKHFKATDALYRNRFRKDADSSASTLGVPPKSPSGPRYGTINEGGEMTPRGTSLRDDQEFQQFFHQVQLNDQEMDRALDRIAAGVQRLSDKAEQVQQELQVQNHILDDTEQKVDKVGANIKTLNKRLKKTINEVEKDKMCMYVICCLLLLGVAGGCYFAITGKK